MNDSTRVVLMGKGELAIRVGEWLRASAGFRLERVVPSMPPPSWTPSLPDWCTETGVPWVESGRYEELPGLETGEWEPELVISVFYSRIVRTAFIQRCERIVNFHNAPLPRYRGVNPINWALANGEPEHGVTLHDMTEGIDDGPIISQTRFSIFPEYDEVEDVYRRCLDEGWLLLEACLPRIMELPSREQNHAEATYYSKKDRERLGDRADWRRTPSGNG